MDCIECKTTNPSGNRFCGQCGAELGRTLDETVRKRGFRDRQATEMEITEAVTARLVNWVRWLGGALTIILILFGILLGKSYFDVRTAVQTGKRQIDTAVRDATTEINVAKQGASSVENQLAQIASDVDRYRKVNQRIEKLQKQIRDVQTQVVDFGSRTLKAKAIVTTGSGPSSLSFSSIGCPTVAVPGTAVSYCAQGSPPSLYQVSSSGELKPVAGYSTSGFQDLSILPKHNCTPATRGTLYVEKAGPKTADKAFLCAKNSDDGYHWLQFSLVP